jgi:cytochrome c oxidase subunit 4
MLRSSLLRAGRSTSSLTSATTALRASRVSPAAACVAQARQSSHAISNPTLANIEKRWEEMEPQEQAELWMSLKDRMKSDWHELTMQEKKACMCSPGVAWRRRIGLVAGRAIGDDCVE